MEIVVLGSGSSGNATIVRSGRTSILLEAGLTAKQIAARARASGCDPGGLSAIFVSHAHSDHVQGAPVFSRRHRIPVHMTEVAYDIWRRACRPASSVASGDGARKNGPFHAHIGLEAGAAVDLGEMRVRTFPVPHDCAGTVGYVVEAEGVRFGYVTDLGHVTSLVVERLRGCDALFIEMNHDPDLLREGPYPWDLKQRIASRHGHLSNEQGASLLEQALGKDTRCVMLGHLSETNNDPGIALAAARQIVDRAGRGTMALFAAEPHRPSQVVRL
jgi:phosphoribosyl 1,2-cyclic phosphodiesterase